MENTITSKQLAGIIKREHFSVRVDITNLLKKLPGDQCMFKESTYIDVWGRTRKCFTITPEGIKVFKDNFNCKGLI